MVQKLFFICLSVFIVSQVHAQADVSTADANEIDFASDTQAPMFIETLWLKPNHNRAATKKIFADINSRKPGSLFLLGDVVNLGYSNKQWKPMSGYLESLRKDSVSVYATLGNHEVMGQTKKGEKKFEKYFPEFNQTGFVEIKDSIAIVLLNSNFGKLSKDENEKQVDWYKKTLQSLDADPAVQFIITGCHHSPYTNSKIVRSSEDVQQKFVPAFLASAKSRLFLSGHSHNFEHYQVQGKDFLVIGGGGGLKQPLKDGKDILPDLAADYKPMFHYLSILRKADRLEVTSFELKKDFSGFDKGLTLEIGKINSAVAGTQSQSTPSVN